MLVCSVGDNSAYLGVQNGPFFYHCVIQMQNDNAKLLAIQHITVQQYLLKPLFTNIIQKLATDAIGIFV